MQLRRCSALNSNGFELEVITKLLAAGTKLRRHVPAQTYQLIQFLTTYEYYIDDGSDRIRPLPNNMSSHLRDGT